MAPHNPKKEELNQQLKNVVDILKLVQTLDDEELVKSTIESVIEILEDQITS